MKTQQAVDQSLERLLAARTPWGRVRLNARVVWKRLSWPAVVNAALFLKRALDIVVSLVAIVVLSPFFLLLALLVKPGITGLWQVGERDGGLFEIGDRNSIDFPEQVSLDVRYIESQSIGKDLWLLAKTVPAILFGKGM